MPLLSGADRDSCREYMVLEGLSSSLLKTKPCVVLDDVVRGYSFEPQSRLVFTDCATPPAAGDVYEGQWKDDKANGEGVDRLNPWAQGASAWEASITMPTAPGNA